MALDPLKRSRQRQGPSPAFHTIGVQGYFGSVQPPLSEIPGSAPVLSPIVICQQLLLVVIDNRKGFWRAKLPRFHTKPSNFLQYSNRH